MSEGEESIQTALERQLAEERRRTDYLAGRIGSALIRIEMRLGAIEERLRRRLTPQQWAKLLTGIGLPLLVAWLTGDIGAALKILAP